MRKQVSVSETSVGTLARGIDVLELFGSRPELSQKEISDALGLPMPTVHRLTALLTERGWLDRDADTRRLRLGLGLTRLVPALLTGMRLPELARPHLTRLAAQLQEAVNLAILDGDEIVYLLSEAAHRLLTPQTTVGMRLPAHCTALGKCLLAQLPEDLAHATLGDGPYERRTAQTLTSWSQLAPALRAIRHDGVTVSEEEYEIGLVSIAVPLTALDPLGTGAINVSLPQARATPPFRAEVIETLRSTAAALDREMGLSGSRR